MFQSTSVIDKAHVFGGHLNKVSIYSRAADLEVFGKYAERGRMTVFTFPLIYIVVDLPFQLHAPCFSYASPLDLSVTVVTVIIILTIFSESIAQKEGGLRRTHLKQKKFSVLMEFFQDSIEPIDGFFGCGDLHFPAERKYPAVKCLA